MRVFNNNTIEIAGVAKKVTLLNFLSSYFLKRPAMQVIVNERQIEFKSLQVTFHLFSIR